MKNIKIKSKKVAKISTAKTDFARINVNIPLSLYNKTKKLGLRSKTTIKAIVTEGPALWAAAVAVLTNSPAPIIAPIPKAINDHAVSVLFNPFSESAASAKSCANGFLFQIDIFMMFIVIKFQMYCFL